MSELSDLIREQARDRAASHRGPLRRAKPDDETDEDFLEEEEKDDPEEIEIDEENKNEQFE